jgi:isocitrate/isopropylmalate dehydrogenase
LLGFIIRENAEGMLANTEAKKQKKRRVAFEKWDYHLKIISEIHQKLGTFS